MVNVSLLSVSRFPATVVVLGAGARREPIEFIPEPSTGMAPDPGHAGLPAKGLFTVLVCPSPDGNLGRGGDGAHGAG